MAITWANVAGVERGQPVALANAFNARLRSGLGDAPWRAWWMIYSLTRELRAPEAFDAPAQNGTPKGWS